jgi:hypothetical protein
MVDILMDDIPDITFEFEKGINIRPSEYTVGLAADNNSVQQQQSADDYPQKPGEICKFYLKGSCMKGPQCPFRHSRNERAVVCKHWLRGLCKKGDLCEFLHEYDLEKMPECYFFSKFGTCSYILILINKYLKIKCILYGRVMGKSNNKDGINSLQILTSIIRRV